MGGQLLCRRVDLSRGVRPELVVVCGRHTRTAPAIEPRLATADRNHEPRSTRPISTSTAVVANYLLRQTSLVALGGRLRGVAPWLRRRQGGRDRRPARGARLAARTVDERDPRGGVPAGGGVGPEVP